MCGITGLISAAQLKDDDLARVERMSGSLLHRGPDSSGVYRCPTAALAVRRLRIIDIEGGDQPLYNEDSSLALVANGEIYNFVELRSELEDKGHVFKTRSDCETILHLYEEHGVGCLNKLRGMFAFALYDKKRGEVLIARDRMGEKPLYYSINSSEFIFSSELKSLIAGLRPRAFELDPDAVNLYLHYQYVPEPLTPLKGIKKLPAAHFIRLKTGDLSFTLNKYWDMEDVAPVAGNPAELIRESFNDLGRYIIRADVPVGIALSGGLDSSAIACAAAKHSVGGLSAFTVGYPGRPDCDERAQAEDLAGRLGMRFCSAELRTEDMASSFPDMVYSMDDPIADVAAFGYYSVSRLAREKGVPVLLLGFGGDELFWGYRWARESLRRNLLKKEIRAGAPYGGLPRKDIAGMLTGFSKRRFVFHPLALLTELRETAHGLSRQYTENPDRFILWDENPDFKSAFNFKKDLYSREFEAAVSDDFLYAPFTTEDWASVPLKTCRFLLDPWNVSNSVAQGDRLGMAFSVENRLPFLDYKFVELVIGLKKATQDDYKLGSKGWFIEAMKGMVPDDVLARPKTGFTPPRGDWLEAVVVRHGHLCRDGALVSAGVMRGDRLAKFFSGRDSRAGKPFFAYKLVLLEMWLRKFMFSAEAV